LLKAATTDTDPRVRVSAIRALGSLKDAKAADRLLERGKALLGNFAVQKTENRSNKNEALEIAATLGRLLPNTGNQRALTFLRELQRWGQYHDPETMIAWAQIDPEDFLNNGGVRIPDPHATVFDWKFDSVYAQGLSELAKSTDRQIVNAAERRAAEELENEKDALLFDHRAAPDKIRAVAAFKPGDLSGILRTQLLQADVITRATAAELLAEQPNSKGNIDALKTTFLVAFVKDKDYDDAQLAILDALFKLDKKQAAGTLLTSLSSPDYLVRKKAFELLADKDLQKELPGIPTSLENARARHKDQVLPYTSAFGTKLGQVLNTDADYRRALSRKNGTIKAVINTQVGAFAIDLLPEDAPLTVDNFVKLARSGYFNGVEVHRVVPNFVMQDGDPRGDGNGGPGWSIRCEINMVPYERGAVGMARSGKDTGGSQWFVTHSPQPHLDGGYTVFGRVNETDMSVVDNIKRGDKIISVKILESGITQRPQRTQRRKK
jgi:cyclophilin family peptidyl-prolyl cis-trans isomerase